MNCKVSKLKNLTHFNTMDDINKKNAVKDVIIIKFKKLGYATLNILRISPGKPLLINPN